MVNAGYTSFLHKIDISSGGLSYVSPSPQSKGRFFERTDVRLANMLNLKKKRKRRIWIFFLLRFICFFNLEHVSSWYPYLTGERRGVAETAERFETWRRRRGGGGGIFHPAIRIPQLKFSKMPLELFVGRSKTLRNNHRV